MCGAAWFNQFGHAMVGAGASVGRDPDLPVNTEGSHPQTDYEREYEKNRPKQDSTLFAGGTTGKYVAATKAPVADTADIYMRSGDGQLQRRARGGSMGGSFLGQAFDPTAPLGRSSILGGN